jgi:flagellar hook protein FlgE
MFAMAARWHFLGDFGCGRVLAGRALMGLLAVFQTSLSGISLAETGLEVGANNLANLNTAGFKASRVVPATQTPRTQSLGSPANGRDGGTNPVQVGRGVQVGAIDVDHTQGAIELSANSAHVALAGQGMFVLQARDGGRVYTRDGRFSVGADDELVAADGSIVLGFAVGDEGELDTTQLRPLRIRIGTAVGTPMGTAYLRDFSIATNGRIRGRYADGQWRDLGQIRLARFANYGGLGQRGANQYAEGFASGGAVYANPGEGAMASLVPGAIERSNTDVGRELVNSLLWDLQFRANVAVASTAGSLVEELLALRRA